AATSTPGRRWWRAPSGPRAGAAATWCTLPMVTDCSRGVSAHITARSCWVEIGRASCRERVEILGGAEALKRDRQQRRGAHRNRRRLLREFFFFKQKTAYEITR